LFIREHISGIFSTPFGRYENMPLGIFSTPFGRYENMPLGIFSTPFGRYENTDKTRQELLI